MRMKPWHWPADSVVSAEIQQPAKEESQVREPVGAMDMLDTLKFDVDTFSDGDAQGKKQNEAQGNGSPGQSLSR